VSVGEHMPSTPKAVIFDIGRVIVRLDLKRALAPIAAAMHTSTDTSTDQSAKHLSPEKSWELIRADRHWQDWQQGPNGIGI